VLSPPNHALPLEVACFRFKNAQRFLRWGHLILWDHLTHLTSQSLFQSAPQARLLITRARPQRAPQLHRSSASPLPSYVCSYSNCLPPFSCSSNTCTYSCSSSTCLAPSTCVNSGPGRSVCTATEVCLNGVNCLFPKVCTGVSQCTSLTCDSTSCPSPNICGGGVCLPPAEGCTSSNCLAKDGLACSNLFCVPKCSPANCPGSCENNKCVAVPTGYQCSSSTCFSPFFCRAGVCNAPSGYSCIDGVNCGTGSSFSESVNGKCYNGGCISANSWSSPNVSAATALGTGAIIGIVVAAVVLLIIISIALCSCLGCAIFACCRRKNTPTPMKSTVTVITTAPSYVAAAPVNHAYVSTWKRETDGNETWFINTVTNESAWDIPPGGVLVN